ncbi:MAG: glycine C-acetyltransferase [Candidatus Dadabacteria bacterium]|nr:MAG: glycine C-acetyltransferase [Candidatus Dadabacteria bacterium]
MYSDNIKESFSSEISGIKEAGLYKNERIIESPQAAEISVNNRSVINFCANNYLGLAHNGALEKAAREGIDKYGLGLSSVRFICGTQTIHKELEKKISSFFETDDAILYASCFDANGGLFETILGPEDCVISDSLNHASIIDGIRLSKAKRLVFEHANMADLETRLKEASGSRRILIATDGVFSMDGDVADLASICQLAEKYGALVMVDDCHGTGFFGPTGRGSVEHCGVMGKVDIITSTLGKALGGAVGGFTTGRSEIIELLRQRSRPYLFSNSLPPAIVNAAIACFDMLSESGELREKLKENTAYFRSQMKERGFNIKDGIHPIVPIMLGEARLAMEMADRLLEEGIYVIGFSYPVVPKGAARIRVQISAAHTREELDRALAAFEKAGKKLGVI